MGNASGLDTVTAVTGISSSLINSRRAAGVSATGIRTRVRACRAASSALRSPAMYSVGAYRYCIRCGRPSVLIIQTTIPSCDG